MRGIAVALGLVLLVAAGPAAARDSRTRRSHARPEVSVYMTPWCGWCRKTLAHLDARGVRYVKKDVEANHVYRAELERKVGRISVPVIEIDGKLLRGFDPERIDALLAGER